MRVLRPAAIIEPGEHAANWRRIPTCMYQKSVVEAGFNKDFQEPFIFLNSLAWQALLCKCTDAAQGNTDELEFRLPAALHVGRPLDLTQRECLVGAVIAGREGSALAGGPSRLVQWRSGLFPGLHR
jgi:hypothetical protein